MAVDLALSRKTTTFGSGRGFFTNESLVCAGSLVGDRGGHSMGHKDDKAALNAWRGIEKSNQTMLQNFQHEMNDLKSQLRQMAIQVNQFNPQNQRALVTVQEEMCLKVTLILDATMEMRNKKPWFKRLWRWITFRK